MPSRRAEPKAHGNKKKLSISPDPDLLAWVQERTGAGKEFANITHAVERGLVLLREHEEGKWIRAKK